jgi:anti-sigma factor RsiW
MVRTTIKGAVHMANCKMIEKKLSAYQDGELGFKEQAQIEAHLQDCTSCRQKYAAMERTWQDLGLISEIRTEAGFYMRIERKIELESQRFCLPKLRRMFDLTPNPAAALALLLAGIVLGIHAGKTITEDVLLPRPHQESIYAQEVTLAAFNTFDPLPPGTLANGYMRMASHREEAPE